MTRTLSEKQVLKKLGIEDFRHLSKDTVMSFASMLPEMDVEVAKKALEQFPNFSETVLGAIVEFKGGLDKVIDDGSESAQQVYASYNSVMQALQKTLENESLTFEERQSVLNQMADIAKLVDEKDEKHKKFLLQGLMVLGSVVIAGVGVLASTLGGNARIGKGN